MINFGLPTERQWGKVLKALIFSFLSAFIAALTAQGGFQVGLGWEGTLALFAGAFVAGVNGVLYTVYITFFESDSSGKAE